MLRRIRIYFFAGILVVVPIGVTIWIFWNLFSFIDTRFDWAIQWLVSTSYYEDYIKDWFFIPQYGVGFIVTILLICLVGFATQLYIGRKVIDFVEYVFLRMPGVSPVYKGLKQVSESLVGRRKRIFEKVVLIEYPRRGIYSLGFVTAEDPHLFDKMIGEPLYYLFVPTTPNPTSGYFLIVPISDAIELPMSVEDAMKMIISSGMVSPDEVPSVNLPPNFNLPKKNDDEEVAAQPAAAPSSFSSSEPEKKTSFF